MRRARALGKQARLSKGTGRGEVVYDRLGNPFLWINGDWHRVRWTSDRTGYVPRGRAA